MWYECGNCGHIFHEEEALLQEVDLENEYGVGSLFPDHHSGYEALCPECESEDLIEHMNCPLNEEEEDDAENED